MNWVKKLRYVRIRQVRRWRSKRLSRRLGACGTDLSLEGQVFISRPEQVHIGNNVHLGDHFWAQTAGGLIIGDNVIISHNCTIHTVNHSVSTPDALPYGTDYVYRSVTIGDNVWVGMNAIITPGSTIGEGAVVGMGAVVAGEIPALAIAVGNPAQVMKYRDRKAYERLKRDKKWLRAIRGIPHSRGWNPTTALARWSRRLQMELDHKGYVTTLEMGKAGAEFTAALLYYFALARPGVRFVQHGPGYMVYWIERARLELKNSGQTSIPLEDQEVAWLQRRKNA